MSTAAPVIKDLSGGVTTFSVPFKRYGVVPIGGRSTAIKRPDGSLFFVASHPLCEHTKAKIDALGGNISHIAALDDVHTLYLESYHKAYPNAKVIGVEPHLQKCKNVKFTAVFGRDENPMGDLPDFKTEYFRTHLHKELALYHEPSKTLIEADLLFNLTDPDQTVAGHREFVPSFITRCFTPSHSFHKRFNWYVAQGRKPFAESAKTVESWDIQRIIPCHGKVIEGSAGEAKAAWQSAFAYYLDAKKP